MEGSEIKEEIVYCGDLKVKEEKLTSVLYEVEVTSEVDIKLKVEDPPQIQLTSVTNENIQSVNYVQPDQESTSNEVKVEPDSKPSSIGTSAIDSDSDSIQENSQQIQQSSKARLMKRNKNVSKCKKGLAKIVKSKLLQCPLCPQSFPRIGPLITHARNEHATLQNPSSDPIIDSDDEDKTLSQCPLCSKSLKSIFCLQNHFIIFHIKNKPFQCSLCLESKNEVKNFPTETLLDTHIAKTHNPARFKFQCDICSHKFTNTKSYERHKEIHKEKKYKCEYCSKAYREKEWMLRHIIAVHKEYTDRHEFFRCDACEDLFCNKKDLKSHVLQTHTLNFIQCKICYKKFLGEVELNKHLNISHWKNRTWLVCDACSKVFKNNKDLVEHLEVDHKRFFKCRNCFKSFVRKEEYERHSTEIYDTKGRKVERPQFQCSICHIFLNTQCSFNMHKDTHLETGEMVNKNVLKFYQVDPQGCPLKCDFCPKTFLQKSLLLDHASECHPNEKWECKTCAKSFQLNYQLVKHELLHSKNKPYECKVCLKSFTNAACLNQHERIHKKMFKCSKCKKSFSFSIGLRLHMANYHGAEKPFKCHICQKTFPFKIYLEEHLRSNLVEGPFGCEKCSHCYKNIELLRRHQKKCDPENPAARIKSVGPHLKYFEDLLFVCVLKNCNFKTKDEKEVAIHNASHGLPQIALSQDLSPGACVKTLDSFKLAAAEKLQKRTIQPRFKCRYCFQMYKYSRSLSEHIKKLHGNVRSARLSATTTKVHADYRKKWNLDYNRQQSKHAKKMVFVCSVEKCDFETKDEKEVAIHYAKHKLPKVILPRLLYGPSSQVFLSKPTSTKKHLIQARYKCSQCLRTLSSPGNLGIHIRGVHSGKNDTEEKQVQSAEMERENRFLP